MDAVIVGFSLSMFLIVAIAAQIAFVLNQLLRKHHVFLVSTICATYAAIMIFAGVDRFGVNLADSPCLFRYPGTDRIVLNPASGWIYVWPGSLYSFLCVLLSRWIRGEIAPPNISTTVCLESGRVPGRHTDVWYCRLSTE